MINIVFKVFVYYKILDFLSEKYISKEIGEEELFCGLDVRRVF